MSIEQSVYEGMARRIESLEAQLEAQAPQIAQIADLIANLQTQRREYLALEVQLDAVKQSSRTLFESYHRLTPL